MRTRLSAALGGIELHSIDPAIYIQRINEGAPGIEVSAGNRSGNSGQHVNGIQRKTMDISIQFSINLPKTEILRRAEILQQVNAWAAAGGNLTVNYRDRQKLRVKCISYPGIDGIDRWTENYEIQFRAFPIPFWQSMDAESVTVAATASQNASISLRETGGGLLCFSAANSSGSTVNTLTIASNNRHFSFTGLGLADGEKLQADYDEDGVQRIRIQASGGTWRSAMAARETNSYDDIILNPGLNTVSLTAGASVAWQIWTYGRWI